MGAGLIHRFKRTDASGTEERVIWEVPRSGKYPDAVRYRLVFSRAGEAKPVVLYDNHAPKGHHRHLGGQESLYAYKSVQRLFEDFERDVAAAKWRH